MGKKPESSKKVLKPKAYFEPSENQHFFLHDGRRLKNLAELLDVLNYIDVLVFNHHVNENKNDFSTWIRDVFQDNELADKVKKTRSINGMKKVLQIHLST